MDSSLLYLSFDIKSRTMLLVLIFGLVIVTSVTVEASYKSLFCNIYDKEYGEFLNCKIKAISRYRKTINVYYRQLKQAHNVVIRIEFLKRGNSWQPFLYNVSVNLCDLLERNRNLVASIAYAYVKPYLTLNISCPLKKNDSIKCNNYDVSMEQIRNRFPVETGEYAVRVTLSDNNVPKVSLNASAVYSNYREH